ncbi:50S ribosomal protein L25/general stress protein Ctc [Kineococcus glutinatus]|uniref:Large ribosomal subunit protein bL25 n=1 Tax=Kineococcus glutinatus TaxID=1070872 RepID=A0ABP9HZA6_9ACTN
MAAIRISAEPRTEFGKGAARRIRRDDKIPAVLYGHGGDPVHLTLPGHATMLALKTPNALLEFELDGQRHLALAKDVQRDVVRRFIEHIDLLTVVGGEQVTVDIPLHITGEPVPGSIVQQELTTVSVVAEATHLPSALELSVEGAPAGRQITAGDLQLPAGVTIAGDLAQIVAIVSGAPSAEEVEAELAEAEAEAGIVHDAPTSTEEDSAEEGSTEAEQA